MLGKATIRQNDFSAARPIARPAGASHLLPLQHQATGSAPEKGSAAPPCAASQSPVSPPVRSLLPSRPIRRGWPKSGQKHKCHKTSGGHTLEDGLDDTSIRKKNLEIRKKRDKKRKMKRERDRERNRERRAKPASNATKATKQAAGTPLEDGLDDISIRKKNLEIRKKRDKER